MIRRRLVGLLLSVLALGPGLASAAEALPIEISVSVSDSPDPVPAVAPVAEPAAPATPEPAPEAPPPVDPAVGLARRAALAERIVQQPSSQAVLKELGLHLSDMAARPIFRQLRRDPGWGPDHPVWLRLFPAFVAAYAKLSEELAPDLPGRMKAALVEDLSEAELSQILATLGNPRFRELERKIRGLGLDQRTALTLVGMSTSPDLYSRGEKEEMRVRVMSMGNREQELIAFNQWLEGAMKEFRTPAFQRYEKIMPEVLSATTQRIKNDEHAMEALKNFVTTWRARVAVE